MKLINKITTIALVCSISISVYAIKLNKDVNIVNNCSNNEAAVVLSNTSDEIAEIKLKALKGGAFLKSYAKDKQIAPGGSEIICIPHDYKIKKITPCLKSKSMENKLNLYYTFNKNYTATDKPIAYVVVSDKYPAII